GDDPVHQRDDRDHDLAQRTDHRVAAVPICRPMMNVSLLRAAAVALLLAAGSPVAHAQLVPVKTVDLGVFHGCSLSESGAVSCWGANNAGQIGDGATG